MSSVAFKQNSKDVRPKYIPLVIFVYFEITVSHEMIIIIMIRWHKVLTKHTFHFYKR